MLRATLIFATMFVASAAGAQAQPAFTSAWPESDFAWSAVPFDEIISGGVPRDGIPAISDPAQGRTLSTEWLP